MEIEHVATAALAQMAAPYNPRRISDHDLDRLRSSLRFFGTVEPIVVNRRSGHIGGGHQRVPPIGPHLDDGGGEVLEEHRDVGALKEFGDVRGLGSPDTFDGRDVGVGTQCVQPAFLVTRVEQDHVPTGVLRVLARERAAGTVGLLAEGAPVHGAVRH